MKARPLSPKQKVFCQEYIACLNITEAGKYAGYKSAAHCWEMMRDPRIQAEIQRLMDERATRTEITADRVLEEIAKVAFINIADFLDSDGRMLMPGQVDRKHMAAVQEFTEQVMGGNDNPIVSRKYKLADKLAALDKLGKHLKLFTDKVETEVTHKGSLSDLLAEVVDD